MTEWNEAHVLWHCFLFPLSINLNDSLDSKKMFRLLFAFECSDRYVSKFRQAVVVESKLNKYSKRTMGPAKLETTSPDNYLKKHSKEPKLPESELFNLTLCRFSFEIGLWIDIRCFLSRLRQTTQKTTAVFMLALWESLLSLWWPTVLQWQFTPKEILKKLQQCPWSPNPQV